MRWSRGAHREVPAGRLPALPIEQSQRIAALQQRYQVRFEAELAQSTSLDNYEYLDILDRAWSGASDPPPRGAAVLCDVGCASFWYAAALDAFFRPAQLLGVDVEGHRLFRDGRSRIDYAAGYTAARPNARFVVADYTRLVQPAEVITAWFPFLTARAILAWRLPLGLLQPERLLRQIHHNLCPGGLFLMVNHGAAEAEAASRLCSAVGFRQEWQIVVSSTLSRRRSVAPVVSAWRHA